MAGRDVEGEGAKPDPLDFFDVMTNVLEHAADLAIAAFDENDFVPGIGSVFEKADFGRSGFDAATIVESDGDPVTEALKRLSAGTAADFDVIGFGDVRGGLGELLGEGAVVGHEEKALAGVIEAAYGIEALGLVAHELHDGGAAFGIADRGDIAFGLVQQEIDETLCRLERLAIDGDGVRAWIGFGAELGDDLAVDGDATREDELFSFAAGGEAGGGEEFLETDHEKF